MTEHNSPTVSFGVTGNKDDGFVQPCNITGAKYKNQYKIFVIDTGNSRIKALDSNLNFEGIRHNDAKYL